MDGFLIQSLGKTLYNDFLTDLRIYENARGKGDLLLGSSVCFLCKSTGQTSRFSISNFIALSAPLCSYLGAESCESRLPQLSHLSGSLYATFLNSAPPRGCV